MGSIITTKKGLLKLVKGQIEVEVNGSNQPAKDGEQLPKGAVLHIGENATYEITFDDGTKLSNEVEPSIAATPNAGGQATQDEIQALQDLIASGEDPTQNLPETAAGNAPAGRDGNSGYVTLARDGTEALATSGYSTSGQTLTAATTAAPEQTVATDSPSVLVNDSITVDEDTVASGNVLDNDSDADNVLSVVGFNINGTDFAAGTVVTLEGGSFILNADGSYTFTPNENWNGQVPVITYTTNTGSTATLTINVTPVDDPSVLANDTNTVAEDTVATGNVLDNDTDVDSSLSVVSFTVSGSTFAAGTTVALEGGSLLLNADGSYSFTPNENWNGQVPVITYTTNTGSTATLTINVTPVDDPSVLANDTNTVAEDTVATGNVLDNDTDVDSSLSVVSFTVSGSTFAAGTTVALEGGSLVLNADGSYSFTPNENWNGQVPVITYTTNTGSTATLTINVTPVDDPSVLANDTNTVAEDTVATGNVLDNDTDVDSSLSVVSFTVSGSTFAAGTTVALEGGSLVLNADGSYSFTPNADWNGQVPVITYTTNTGSTATLTINVTPVADGAPSVTITTDTNDDGFISNAELGGATDVSVTIGLDGTGANAGDTLTVNGVDYVLTQEDINNGYVNLTLPAPAEGETITVVATITDPAGNTSPEGSDSALLDTTAPTITVSAPDDTRDTTPTITGTTDAAPGSLITIVVTDSNGVQQTLTTTVNPDGTYAVDVINPIPHGGYTATATVTDPAGNTGNATDNGNVDIKIDEDGDGNTVAITSITQDTGSSSSDFITNDNTLVFHGTVDLDDNSTLAVTINGVTYTTANGLVIDAQGNWSVDLTGTVLPDGTYPVVATVTDVAGNSKTVTQDVVIDTKIDQDGDGNTVAITSITQDTGSSSSDFITNDNTLVFHGTVDLDDNSTLAVTINGVTYTTANGLVIDAQGNWSVDLTGTVLPDGTYPVVATVTDVAGNSKTVTQDVVIDTKIDQDGDGNTVAITSITQDTGSSSSDFITNDNTLVFHGTVDLDDNSTLAVTINGVTYTTANGLVIDAQGNWSVDLTGTVLPDGTYPVVATVTDIAGNTTSATQDVIVDTQIGLGRDNAVTITSITEDTGSSNTDFITNDNTLVFQGTVELDGNSNLVVTINGVEYTIGNGLVIDANGHWSVDLTGTVLPDGTYPVVATVTDVAGNSKTVTQDVVIDTKIDQDGDGNTVAITSITQDTGSSSSDFITNDNTLVFHGTVDLDDNSTLAVTINGVTYTTANGLVIDAQGNWSVDLTGTVLPDGTYPVVATVTDVAGNSKTVTQDVVIDTKIDQDGDGNTVAITSITQDTGSSSSDFITNDNTLVFHGTVDLDDNSTLAVTINGVTYTTANGLVIDAQGNWSVDLTGTVLPDGTYPVVATVTDVAGNSKTVTQDVVIDTKIDQDGDGNTVAITSITQDTGSSSSDFITNDNTLVFHGTVDLDDNSTLAVTINGVTYTTANGLVIDAQGNWSVDLTGTVLADGTYTVNATVTDVAGNFKTVTQDVIIDTQGPSVVVNIVDDVLTVGETSEVTFTFSEKVTGFDASDLVVVGGTLSNLSSTDGINWTATFTPTPGFTGTASVTVTAGSYTDLNGNLGTSGSDTAGVDTQGPSVVVNIVDDVLTVGETSEVTFTFSEKVTGFDASDLVVVGGTLSNLSSTDGINWTATFTPTPGFTGTASVTVTAGSYTDLNGNLGTSGSDTAGVDTQGPSVVVNIVDDVLTVGETSEVTFTFSEKVTGFDASDLVVVGGTLSNLSSTDGINWTATFTPTPGFTGTASVTVTAGSYTDLNGNLGTSGSDTAGVDTQGPSVVVNIVDDVLTVGETSEVTFTFSEKVTGFDASDLVVVGGTLSNLSSTNGINWTATFTPTPGFTGTASVTVTAGSYTDLNGNLGTSGSDTAGVDTQGPSVVVNIVDDVLTVGETSEVTFTFSEKVTGFDASDLVVVGGTLSNLSSTDGINWTATFTPTPGFTGTASVTVTVGSYTDLNGNLGTSGSDTAGVDTQGPSVVVNIVDDVLTVGETSEVTFTFSEKVTGFDASDLVVVGGTLSNLSSTDGINWTATFTPTPGFTGTASVTVTAGSYTDLNGNLGASGSDTAGVDTQGPSVVVNIVDDVLTVGETSEVTFTFSEKVTGFDASDLVVVGGTLSNLSSTDGINWTATFTPTPGFTGTASVTVTAGSYTDLNGNLGTSGSDTAGVDTQGPSVVVNIVDDVLTVGETSEVTFTFSEKVTGFDASDLVVVGGTLSNLSSTDGINWTATFTPTPGFTGTASVTVTAGSYTDLNGNLGTSGSDTAGVDTQGPSVVVNIVDDVLTVGETSEVTFTFSEKVTGFDASDLVVVGGTLSNLSSTDGINWTATFTPTPGFTGTASVTVTAGSYTDLNGNLGTSGSDTAGVDTQGPSVVVNIVDDVLTVGETSEVTFTFSEKVTGFDASDLVVVGGTLSNLSSTDGINWTATFTPTPGFTGTASVTVTAGSYTDLNGNLGTSGSDTAGVDTQGPSVVVNIVDDVLTVGETSEVTFTFSEKVTGFDASDLVVVGGTLSNLSSTDGINWTATFTPTPGFTGTASVTVTAGSYTDLNGNLGTSGSDTAGVDTQGPSVVVNIVDDVLTVGETSEVTFTFSEKVTGFDASDLVVVGGTLSNLSSTDGINWTATFTPTPGFTGTASVTVTAGSYTDLNGNLGTSGSDTAGVDTQGPSVVVNIVDDVLTVGETSEVTFTFSEKVTGFDASDLVVVGGTLSNLSSTDGINWTATFTPTPGFTGTASVTVTVGSYTDLNGNLGTSGSDTAGVDTQGPSVVVNIVDDVLTVGETSEVTFTFSEKVTGFDASDLVVVGGTLSNLSSTDGINWTATFTPTPGFTGTPSVTVTAGSYTDLNGNLGTSGSDTAGVDTQGPSVVVNIVDDVLTVGETSEVTFTFSEKVTGFDASDLVVVGGTLSNLSSTDGINWTATFTPTPGFTGTASVTVTVGSYTDLNGNLGTSGSDTAGVDTQGPSVVVNIVDDVLTVGETSEVTFTFSEKVTGFDASDLVVVGGTLSNLSSTDGINWTATFTPTPGFTGTASVTVTAGSYTDLNGNLGTSGSDTAGVDTQGPSVVVNIVDDVLTVGETSEVTFTFSEKVTGFDASDLVVVGGTLSNLSSTDGINWTATFTPTPGFTGTASVTVTAGSYTDLNGNLGTSGSDTAGVDTQGPSVVVNIVDDVLTVGETSEVTFTFSEKVTGFDASDLVVVGGTLSNLSSTDGINWTATFTPTPGFTGTASVTVTAGSYTDLNGNLGTSGSDTAGVDTQGPSVVVNIVDDVLTVGETSEVTFAFSEKVTGFDASDLVVVGGTLSNLSSTDGINWTATFTPTPGFTGTASVTVTAGSYTDLNGNLGTSGSDTAGVDTQGPSVVVNIVDDVLTVGETSEVTFTFSEKVTGFDASDLVVVGGTLSNLSSTDGINWTATFTPTPGFTGTASVTVTAGSYTDLNGNLGTSGSDTAGVDTQGPSVVVNIVDDVLTVGETSEVTFTFSEKVTGFDASDLVVVGGTLSNLSSTDGINWTATFTPTPGFTGTASVTVTAGSYTDLNGNLGTSGSDTAGVDTQGPSVVVNIVDDVLTVGETSEVTFTFSEKVTGFDASDLVVVGGTLSNLSSTDGINWTATFTPTPGFTGTASVTVTAGSYTDLNGNLGTSGSDTAGVDTQGPSVVVNIVDDVLTVGETSEVTFTFSEKVTGFDASDLVVVGGTLSNLSSTDGINWTATFTPTPGFTGTASVTVTAGSYTDLNGNLGTSGSDTAGVDTQGPSVVVNIVDDVLTVGETSEVTFTFSEKVTGFDASDLVVVGGTLSNLSSTDGINWTATFTPTPGFTGTASVTVTAGSYTDLNGNLGTSGSDTAGVDTQGPSVVVNIVDDVLTVGETSEVTFTFSEKVTGFDASDLVVVGGTLSNLSSTDGINWTATFTPTPGFTGTASVTVTVGSYTDLNGNLGTSGSDTAGVDTQGPSVVVNIVDDVLTVGETSEVTFTFSEKVTGFDASDLVVVGGTLSNLSSTDGINWTATFTPTPGFTGTASVTVTAGSYTDLNGNLGTSGSDTAGVDTQGPSVVVNIVDDVLTVGETSEVTFTFSEKVTGFDASDLVVVGGTLSNLSSTDGINWTATFTPTPGFTGTASVTVTVGSYTDLNGNLGTSGSDTAGVDTQGPSVVVNIVDDVLTVGETSEVTFTFSEKVTGFDASDLVVVGGTLSNLSSTDGINWTATFTPTPGFTGTASVTVTAGSYTDLNGNLGTSGSDTAGVDTQGPSVVVNIVDDVLTVGETSEVTFTFSEKVTGFDASDLVVVGGTLSNLSSTDGINWTATFTPTPGFTGTASVTVTAGSYTDLNGNLGTSGSDTAGVDTQGPSVVVNIVDDVLTVGETSEVTFTFSEKVTGFDASDLVVVGGTLSNLSSTDGINWTATFTPTPGFTGTASVTVTAGSYTDLNGNLGTSGSDTAGVDTQGPSVVVNIVDDVLTVGETSEVTFTFSEKVTGFDASDLVVVGGTLSNLSSTDGINWTATFTPTPGFTGTASVTVTAGSYTDLNGNLGTSGSDTAGVDTQGPSVVVNIVDDVLTVGETSEVTFTFSEKVTGFDASDLVVVGGTLSNLSSTDGINWTATFTPTPGFTGTASVTVTAGSYTDLNGNLGTSGSDTAGVDTQGPSVVVNIVDDVLTVGETSEVTFTFSEKVTGFDASDLVVVGGTLSNLSSTDGINWTATFTPTPGFTGTASVTVTAGSYTDLNGNLGTSGSDTAGVDTQGPSVVVNIVDDVLTVGETSEVTFTFSEKVTGFDASDLVVVGGTLSNLSSTDGINWTATFTPTPGFTGTASVTVTVGSYTDLNGNLGTSGSDTAGVDTQGPSVVVNIVDDVLTVGETSEVTFTFSEKVTGFDASDLVVVGGTLSNLSSTDGINWTATFTPTPGFTGTASVTVTAGSYTDLNGNLGTSGSDTAGVDTQGPSVVVNIVDDVLTVGETSEVTFTFSEKVTGFDASDLVVVGGTLSNLSSTDGINWTATFTPTPGFTGTASVTVTAGSYTDLNGNLGTSGSDTAGVDTQGPSVVVNIVDDVLTVGETSEVTFTFSEKVTGFDASDLVVVGGTLSNLSSTDGINWTATFTPTPGFTGTASVTVTAGSYTDLNGNLGTSGSDTAGVDTQGPSVVVNIVDDVLTVGETSEVTFTFSEKVTGFDASDLVVVGGTLSNLSSTDGINWTATFTPTPGFTGTASVTVTVGSYTDLNGNLGTSGSDTAGVDTQGPSVVVNIVDDVLTVGETSEVTFTFSEKVTGFDASDLVVVGGTLSNLSSTDGINWTATFTPTPGFTGTASVTVTAGSYTDLNGNLGTSGVDTAGVDTSAPNTPTVLIVDDGNPGDGLLTAAEMGNDGVQLTVSINGTDFEAGGYVTLTIDGGAAIQLSFADFTDNGSGSLTFDNYTYANGVISWTETAPADGQSITVTATQTDKAGNTSAEGSDTALVDTTAPTAPTVLIVDDANPDDGLLTQGEIDGNGAGVQLTVSIDAEDFSAGGHVNLTIVNAGVTTNVELKLVNGELQFANGNPATGYSYNATTGVISWTETRPADGALLKVEATQTDKAGNTSDKGSDQATVIYTSDDSFTKQEDQLVTGQLLTNDHSSNTSIVSFTVMYNGTLTSFNAGQTVALSIGSLLIQANGEFKFIPNQHWSGDVSTVTYTTNTGDTATLNITVQPVADKPLVDVILTANGTPLYSGFISSGITTEQFRNGDFTHQPFNTGAKQTDASSGQDTVYGSNGNDHIVSTNGGGDHLLGYAGNDVLVGGDAIQGDTINGGIGNDILVAGLGQDSLYGGEGNDIAVLMGNRADYIITKDYRYSQWDNWFNFTTIEHGQTITKALHDIEYIQFDDGIYELDKNTGELVMVQPTYVDYPVEIHASLTDRDGSELLDSIELSGLPAGTQVFYNGQLLGVADNDGKLLLDYDGPDGWTGGNLWAENALDATLTGVTIRVPGTSAGQVDLVVEAVAREKGTDLTNSATGEDTIRLDYFKGTEGEPGDQNVNFGSEHNIVVGDLDGSIVLPGQNYNIAFMVDSSGSINADTLETMKLQLAQVLETLKDSASGQQSGTVKIFLVDFDTHAKGSISVDLSDPNALDILQDALDDMSSGGGTNYEDVFTTTANWFANGDAQNNSGATNLAFFITDGKPTYYNAVPGGNPLVYDTWGSNNDRSLSQLIGSGYVFGQVYTVNGHVVIDENGNVFSVDVFNSVSRSPVGAMRPDAQGNYQYYALAGNGRDSSADTISNSQAGFALLSSLGVTVQAIGMGSNIDEDDLLPYDSDDNVQTNVDADDLADAILGDQVNAIPGADRFDGGAGDDVIFGDAIHFTGISGQGFAAIKAYVADKLGIADASDAQVHRYISEHSDEFDQSGANDKADIILGGAGNDILFGQGGNDYLDGGAGKDTLYGGNGNDTLIGGAGNDTLIGGAGNDTLIGGLGDDVLRGDSGNDTFVWRYADADKGTDHIMDFNVSEDKLDLSDLLQGETAGTLESYLNFSLDSNGSTVIDIDANKDGVFDQHIVLDGVNLFSQYSATDNAGVINGLLGTNGNGPLIIDAAPVTPDAPQGVTSLIDPHNNNGTIIP